MAHYKDGGGRDSRKRARDDFDGKESPNIVYRYYSSPSFPLHNQTPLATREVDTSTKAPLRASQLSRSSNHSSRESEKRFGQHSLPVLYVSCRKV